MIDNCNQTIRYLNYIMIFWYGDNHPCIMLWSAVHRQSGVSSGGVVSFKLAIRLAMPADPKMPMRWMTWALRRVVAHTATLSVIPLLWPFATESANPFPHFPIVWVLYSPPPTLQGQGSLSVLPFSSRFSFPRFYSSFLWLGALDPWSGQHQIQIDTPPSHSPRRLIHGWERLCTPVSIGTLCQDPIRILPFDDFRVFVLHACPGGSKIQ